MKKRCRTRTGKAKAFLATLTMAGLAILGNRAAHAQGEAIHIGSLDDLLWSVVKTIQYYSLPIMAIVLAFLGVKLMTSGDDTSAKESIKGWIIKIVIGGFIIFSAATIASVLKDYIGG